RTGAYVPMGVAGATRSMVIPMYPVTYTATYRVHQKRDQLLRDYLAAKCAGSKPEDEGMFRNLAAATFSDRPETSKKWFNRLLLDCHPDRDSYPTAAWAGFPEAIRRYGNHGVRGSGFELMLPGRPFPPHRSRVKPWITRAWRR